MPLDGAQSLSTFSQQQYLMLLVGVGVGLVRMELCYHLAPCTESTSVDLAATRPVDPFLDDRPQEAREVFLPSLDAARADAPPLQVCDYSPPLRHALPIEGRQLPPAAASVQRREGRDIQLVPRVQALQQQSFLFFCDEVRKLEEPWDVADRFRLHEPGRV